MKASESADSIFTAFAPRRSRHSFKLRTRDRSRSTRTTTAAPRDAASKPSAPLPANASRQRQPSRSCPSQLNSVSRTLSGVGRKPGRSATGSLLRFHCPPMMRTSRGGPRRGAAVIDARECRDWPSAPLPRPQCAGHSGRCWRQALRQRRPSECRLPGGRGYRRRPKR